MKRVCILVGGCLVAAIIGFFVGRETAAQRRERLIETWMFNSETVRAHSAVTALALLNDKREYDARWMLEMQLDSAVMTFAPYSPQHWPDAAHTAISAAREYRRQHPWTNSPPSVSRTINSVFEKI